MGSLWVADHLRLRVPVVVKFITSELAENPEARARFEREAAATMAAKSAHVVQILDYGYTEQGTPFIAMELLEGEDLAAKIAREIRIGPVEFAEILRQACKGLTRAHTQGIVHRDIKPENIFLSLVDGELCVKVLDFGIAKADPGTCSLATTKTGVLLGTAFYMSPEQTMGAKNVDHRADLWSLGVVAYYALTGVRPFESESIGALVTNITTTPIVPPSRYVPALGVAIDRWMLQALARDPAARFTCAKDMAAAFCAAVAEWQVGVIADCPATLPGPPAMPNEWDYPVTPSPIALAPGTLAGPPANRWGPPPAAPLEPIPTPPHASPEPAVFPPVPPSGPVVFHTASSAGSSSATNPAPAKRSYGLLLLGMGIGVVACIAFLSLWGREATPNPHAASAPRQVSPVDSRAAPEILQPVLTGAERGASSNRAVTEPESTVAPAPPSPTPPAARAVTGSARARTSVPRSKPEKRVPVENENPFNGTY